MAAAPNVAPGIRLEVPDARLINTRLFSEAQRRIEFAHQYRKMLLFWGPSGCGKSTAAQLARLLYGNDASIVTLDGNPTPKTIANEVLQAFDGVPHWETRFRARLHLIEALNERPRFLVFDELHLSRSIENIEFIRGIHMRCAVPILLTGDHALKSRLGASAQILRRLHQPLWFGPLSPEDVLKIIPQWHPIYADADPRLISRIDSHFAEGNLGNWSKFTTDALGLGATQITKGLADEIIRSETGFRVTHALRSR